MVGSAEVEGGAQPSLHLRSPSLLGAALARAFWHGRLPLVVLVVASLRVAINRAGNTERKEEHRSLAHMLQLAPNSRYTNVSGLKDTRKCKEKDCGAMLRVRKSSRFCKLKGDKVEIVSGYVIIGALEHNHSDEVPLYAFCPYETHQHITIEKLVKSLRAAKEEVKKLFKKCREENRMKKRDQTIHYFCREHRSCSARLRIVKLKNYKLKVD